MSAICDLSLCDLWSATERGSKPAIKQFKRLREHLGW